MLQVILIAALLVAVTVTLHAAGFTLLLHWVLKSRSLSPGHPGSLIWLLIQVAWGLILVHVLEITVWALFYLWVGCMPDAESAFYFSGATYTTIGYGDLVLPEAWRMLGPIEGLAGLLMGALSGGMFFALVNRIYARRFHGMQGPLKGAPEPGNTPSSSAL